MGRCRTSKTSTCGPWASGNLVVAYASQAGHHRCDQREGCFRALGNRGGLRCRALGGRRGASIARGTPAEGGGGGG